MPNYGTVPNQWIAIVVCIIFPAFFILRCIFFGTGFYLDGGLCGKWDQEAHQRENNRKLKDQVEKDRESISAYKKYKERKENEKKIRIN